ncbi:hypothetical protein GGI35DRAFT_490773 [Trichoderma velutinum]
MAITNILPLFLLAASTFVSPAKADGWLIADNPSPIHTGTQPYMRSCLWVITQAFDRYAEVIVSINPNSYLRWGQERCVVEVYNGATTTKFMTGGQMADALIQTMITTSSTYGYGGVAWHKDGQPYFTVAHSKFFGGNIGQPERRDTDKMRVSSKGVPLETLDLDSKTRDFVEHLRSIDFNALEQMEEPHPKIPDEFTRRSATTDLGKRGKKTMSDCRDTRLKSGATERECTCLDPSAGSIVGRYIVECSGQRSESSQWTLQAFYDAVGALRSNIISLAQADWPDDVVTVAPTTKKGGTLFIPAFDQIRPSAASAECCEALLQNMVASYGFANNMCHCEKPYPQNEWHMLISDAIYLSVGA